MKQEIKKLEVNGVTYVPKSDKTKVADELGELDLGEDDFLLEDCSDARVEHRNDDGGIEYSIDIMAEDLVEAATFMLKLHEKNEKDE